jgi:ABC-type multidrug transport system fused ATPase/permease subunit
MELGEMKIKHIMRDMALITVFMAIDGFVIYSYGVLSNTFSIGSAIIFGVLVATLLDVPPYLFSALGFGKLLDPTTDSVEEKRGARLITLLGIVYFLVIFGALFYIRFGEIQLVLADAARFDERFVTIISSIIPLLTSVASVVLGIRSGRSSGIKTLEEQSKAANEELSAAEKAYAEKQVEIMSVFSELEAIFDCPGLSEEAQKRDNHGRPSGDFSKFIKKASERCYIQMISLYRLYIEKCYNELQQEKHRLCLELDPYGAAPCILIDVMPSNDFESKSQEIKKVDEDFEKQINEILKRIVSQIVVAETAH